MKTSRLFTIAAISTGLSLGAAAYGHEKANEQPISSYDVPAAVQHAAESHAKGGTIVRWEKEGANYEAVVDKNGKQLGFTFDNNGKLVSKHDEGKEDANTGRKS
jgi:hypothetical protein